MTAAALLLVSAVIVLAGCNSEDDSSQATETRITSVQRGDLTVDILASGNLAMPHEANLTFGSSGTVQDVLVKIGDTVEEGQELAKLDTIGLERDVIQAQTNIKSAQMALERAKEPKTSSSGDQILSAPDPLDIEIKEFQLETAKMSLDDARKLLEAAVIVAPFAGQIAEVPVLVGDRISDTSLIVRLIDPTQTDVDVLVNEMDISQVTPGARATVQIDSMPSVVLPARVASISPMATIQSGVVNYTVKVSIESLDTASEGQGQNTGQDAQDTPRNFTSGQMPDRLRQAIEEGRMTEEQVEEIMNRRQQQGAGPGQNASSYSSSTTIPEGFQIREGLTVTVSIILNQRQNVLLVPNSAIIRNGRDTVVNIMKDGALQQVAVTTGISNAQNTEIVEGLNEGDEVVITQAAATSSTSSPTTQQGRTSNPARDMQRMFR